MISRFLSLFCIVFLLNSCVDPLERDNSDNTPSNNFDILWNDLDRHYGLFEVRGWNWDSIRIEYSEKITDDISDEQLWEYLTEVLDYLDDSHTVIHSYEKDSTFRSGYDLNRKAIKEFDLELVEDLFLENLQSANEEDQILYANLTDKNIGYIHIKSFRNYEEASIDIALDALWDRDAIIVDIRNARGGTDIIAERISGVFADGEHFVYSSESRNGAAHSDFDMPLKQYSKLAGDRQYLKPVMLLTDRKTISAAEEFTLHMKSFEHVVQIGDYTAGDLSDVSPARFLPVGWVYLYSYQQYLLPDGTSIDGVGATPDHFVKNTEQDIEAKNDQVMNFTINFLKEAYGIE